MNYRAHSQKWPDFTRVWKPRVPRQHTRTWALSRRRRAEGRWRTLIWARSSPRDSSAKPESQWSAPVTSACRTLNRTRTRQRRATTARWTWGSTPDSSLSAAEALRRRAFIWSLRAPPLRRLTSPRERAGEPPRAVQQTRRLLANARERTRVHTISAAFEALRKQVASAHAQHECKIKCIALFDCKCL